MNDPETRLARLWALEEPPARDPKFEAAVAARIERRRLVLVVLEWSALAAAALTVVWAAWPILLSEWSVVGPVAAVAGAVGLAVWSIDLTFERLAFGGYEDFTRDSASE